MVRRLTDAHEAERDAPWAVSDAPESYISGQLRGIVGIALAVTRFDAKWKMSQNRSDADVGGVIATLAASEHPVERAAAQVVAESFARRSRDE